MKEPLLYTILSLVIFLVAFNLYLQTKKGHKRLPPSPPALPVFGHLHPLKSPVPRTFHRLSQKHGPVFSLWFGSRRIVVVSSPAAVEECFTKKDVIRANHPSLLMGKHVGYNYTTVAVSPYGDHWRNLRRIGSLEIFSSSCRNAFSGIRRNEIKRLLRKLSTNNNSLQQFAKVDLVFSELAFNIIMRMLKGKRYFGDEVSEEEEARMFRGIVREANAYGGAANPGDFLPILNWFGNDGYEKRVTRLAKRIDAFLQGLIEENRRMKEKQDSVMGHLLSLKESQPEYYTDQIIKEFITLRRPNSSSSSSSFAFL